MRTRAVNCWNTNLPAATMQCCSSILSARASARCHFRSCSRLAKNAWSSPRLSAKLSVLEHVWGNGSCASRSAMHCVCTFSHAEARLHAARDWCMPKAMGTLKQDLLAQGMELRETHISEVFLTESLVFKVKKPVSLGFLDFSSLEARKRYCEAEVQLNRRLADQVYRGVRVITRDAPGIPPVA